MRGGVLGAAAYGLLWLLLGDDRGDRLGCRCRAVVVVVVVLFIAVFLLRCWVPPPPLYNNWREGEEEPEETIMMGESDAFVALESARSGEICKLRCLTPPPAMIAYCLLACLLPHETNRTEQWDEQPEQGR